MYLFHFRCKKMFVAVLAIFILYQYEQKELLISIPFLLGCLTLFLTVLAICITYLLARSKATASIYFFRFYVFYKLTKLFISFFQVVKMFVTVMVIFATCWCPYHLYFLLSYYFPDIQKQPYTRLVDQSKKTTT